MHYGNIHRRARSVWVAAVFLLGGMLLLQAVPAAAEPPRFAVVLAGMKAKLAAISDYQCRFETQSTNGAQTRNVVLAYYYRQPAQIRMEVLEGPYPGSLLIYNGETDAGRVRVLAGNRLVAFLQRMLYGEYFAVDHEWVVDLRGNGIHESGWPHFIRTHEAYLSMGTSRFVREEILDGRVAHATTATATAAPTRRTLHGNDAPRDFFDHAKAELRGDLHQSRHIGHLPEKVQGSNLLSGQLIFASTGQHS